MNENKRVALVTGANKGIGLEIARQLGQARIAPKSPTASTFRAILIY